MPLFCEAVFSPIKTLRKDAEKRRCVALLRLLLRRRECRREGRKDGLGESDVWDLIVNNDDD